MPRTLHRRQAGKSGGNSSGPSRPANAPNNPSHHCGGGLMNAATGRWRCSRRQKPTPWNACKGIIIGEREWKSQDQVPSTTGSLSAAPLALSTFRKPSSAPPRRQRQERPENIGYQAPANIGTSDPQAATRRSRTPG